MSCKKRHFAEKVDAEAAASSLRKLGNEQNAYRCDECKCWHTGHSSPKADGYEGDMETAPLNGAPKRTHKQTRLKGQAMVKSAVRPYRYAQPEINNKLPEKHEMESPRLFLVPIFEILGVEIENDNETLEGTINPVGPPIPTIWHDLGLLP